MARQVPPNPSLRRKVSAQFKRCIQLLQSLSGPHRMLEPDPGPDRPGFRQDPVLEELTPIRRRRAGRIVTGADPCALARALYEDGLKQHLEPR